jgi:hypothetical protein
MYKLIYTLQENVAITATILINIMFAPHIFKNITISNLRKPRETI